MFANLLTKKLLPFTLIGIGIGVTPISSAQDSFPDTENHWAQSCISQLSQRGIISGYPDGTFRPWNSVTRAEFASLIHNTFVNRTPVREAIRFQDVPENYWAAEQIESAYRRGFLSGYPGQEFRPAQQIPRVQAFVALASGLNYSPNHSATQVLNRTYVDAGRIPEYAYNSLAGATQRNIVINRSSNRHWIDPNQNATRAEIAASLCQVLPDLTAVSSDYVARENQYVEELSNIQQRDNYQLISPGQMRSTQVNATPEEAALNTFGFREEMEGRASEVTEVNYLRENTAVVMLTQTNLPDDSVRDVRYRVEVVRESTPQGQSWEIVWAGSQQRCQAGRGSQEWTTDRCI